MKPGAALISEVRKINNKGEVSRMFEGYQVDEGLNIPIYQQLVDKIRADIKAELLPAGTQLPTVRALAQQMNLARGTVKRAYDELEDEKLVEKMQGSGTFVCYRPMSRDSRKEQAMHLIDEMLNQLEELRLSASEMEIFLNLKLRERKQLQQNLKVALVASETEIQSQLYEQLRSLPGVDLYSYSLRDVQLYPYRLPEDISLIVTDADPEGQCSWAGIDPERITRTALRPTAMTVRQLARLRRGTRVGIVSSGSQFAGNLQRDLSTLAELSQPAVVCEGMDPEQLHGFLQGVQVLLVPEGFEKYTDAAVSNCIRAFSETGTVIACCYEADDGSVLSIREKLARTRRN